MHLVPRAKLLLLSGALALGGLIAAAPAAHAFRTGPVACTACGPAELLARHVATAVPR
jgi:hypothetical protein